MEKNKMSNILYSYFVGMYVHRYKFCVCILEKKVELNWKENFISVTDAYLTLNMIRFKEINTVVVLYFSIFLLWFCIMFLFSFNILSKSTRTLQPEAIWEGYWNIQWIKSNLYCQTLKTKTLMVVDLFLVGFFPFLFCCFSFLYLSLMKYL